MNHFVKCCASLFAEILYVDNTAAIAPVEITNHNEESYNIDRARGKIEYFLLFDTHYLLSEKKGFCGTQHKIQKCLRKKQAKVCGQTKIANVALSPSQGEATSTLIHPTAYTIAQHCSGIGRNAFVQIFPSLLGKLG